jgi:hypothetical protein
LTIGHIVNSNTADIEDMFEVAEYLSMYNEAFNKSIQENNLQGKDPLVKRIERIEGEFNHGLPADLFLRKRDEKLNSLSKATLDRFESLFKEINQTLET